MTVTNTGSSVTYTGNGATTIFAYAFRIPLATDVVVTLLEKATGVETVLSSSQYTITGLDNAAGGDVTYPISGTPLAATHKITIERAVPYTQLTAIPNQGNFFAAAVELAVDRITMMVQQMLGNYERTLRIPLSDDEIDPLVNADLRANKTLGFDANGVPMVGSTTVTLVSSAMEPVVQAATTALARVAIGINAIFDAFLAAGTLGAAVAALFAGTGRVGSAVILTGAATIDLASAASSRTSVGAVTVTGAVVGDVVLSVTASGDATTLGGFLFGMVTAADTVTIFYMNGTAGALNPASQDYTVRVLDVSTIA